MASARGFAQLADLGLMFPSLTSLQRHRFCSSASCRSLSIKFFHRVSISVCNKYQNSVFLVSKPSSSRGCRLSKSVELDHFLTSDDEEEICEGFLEAIEELERMAREPSDILEEMDDRLPARNCSSCWSTSQNGRDSWCALEVFDWLLRENRVDKETMELVGAIMCGWAKKLIQKHHCVGDVVDLLVDMECVGLKPGFSMIEKVISLYWEMGEKERAVMLVEEVLRRRISYAEEEPEGHKGATGYLAWKMMVEGDYRGAIRLVINFREPGLKPEAYSYLMAMTAVVKELNEFGKALHKLKGFVRAGMIAELDHEDVDLIEKYQSDLLADGVCLSNWVMQDGSPSLYDVVHERLLAISVPAEE